jgi:hypothetical protein
MLGGMEEEALRELARLTEVMQEADRAQQRLEQERVEAVRAARVAGASWEAIGRAVGTTGAAAWQRWHDRV